MPLSWLSVDARTGVILADLPDLDVDKVSRSICRYDSTMGTLPIPTAPDGWLEATRPGGSCMVLLDDDTPIWGGLVTQRTRGSGDTINLALATIESYLDRRFVGDVTYTQVGQNAIVADLITRYITDGAIPGIPIRVMQVGGAGTARDRTYTDASDKTVYSVLQELSGVIGGPEWTIEWEHLTSPERYRPVLFVGARIGTAVTPGLSPAATFEMPGPVTEATYVEDYAASKGSNSVIATSSAVADIRPQSPAQTSTNDGRPTFEHRYTPSTSITNLATLTAHAVNALSSLKDGATVISLSAATVAAPRLGTEWVLGDDLGWVLGGPIDGPRRTIDDGYGDVYSNAYGTWVMGVATIIDSVPAFPGGMSGVARCWGWELSLGSTPIVIPILAQGV